MIVRICSSSWLQLAGFNRYMSAATVVGCCFTKLQEPSSLCLVATPRICLRSSMPLIFGKFVYLWQLLDTEIFMWPELGVRLKTGVGLSSFWIVWEQMPFFLLCFWCVGIKAAAGMGTCPLWICCVIRLRRWAPEVCSSSWHSRSHEPEKAWKWSGFGSNQCQLGLCHMLCAFLSSC